VLMIIACCAAFALPAWVACWLITMNEPGRNVPVERRPYREGQRTSA
jgi:hypothetical protein